jgi:hypothetical protein
VYLPGRIEKNHGKPAGQELNPGSSEYEYEARVLTIDGMKDVTYHRPRDGGITLL